MATALEQIAELRGKIAELKPSGAEELREKMVVVRKKLSDLEAQYHDLIGGKISGGGSKIPAGVRRPKVTDEELTAQIRAELSRDGTEGLSGMAMAEAVGQGYPRITKFLKDNPRAFKRTGTGKHTKYFLP
jgi:TolA-binding protein